MKMKQATDVSNVQQNGNTSGAVWILMAALVLIIGIFSITYSVQVKASNDIDNLRLFVLSGNISSLTIQELINLHNITILDQNITQSELHVLLLNSRVVSLQGNILILQDATQTIQTNITVFYENITTLFEGIDAQWIFIQNLNTSLQNAIDTFIGLNQSAVNIVSFGLRNINNLIPVNSNIDFIGQCGFNASAGILAGTVFIDACALENQVVNLTNTLQVTAAALFASVNMSNTTLDTINGQSPNAGQIFIVAGTLASIYPGTQSNAISIANTGILRINNIVGANSIVSDGYTKIVSNTSAASVTVSIEPFIQTLNTALGIVNIAPPNPNGLYQISTPITAYGALSSSLSSVCMYAISTTNIPTLIWSAGPASSTSYANLLTCTIPFNSSEFGVVTKDCRYNMVSPALTGHGACFDLFDSNAIYTVEFDVTVTTVWSSPNAWPNVNRLELQYCLYGPTGCGITSSNWTRAIHTSHACYISSTLRPLTLKYTALIASGNNTYSRIMARLYCRMSSADDFGNYVKPCYNSASTRLNLLLSITRVV